MISTGKTTRNTTLSGQHRREVSSSRHERNELEFSWTFYCFPADREAQSGVERRRSTAKSGRNGGSPVLVYYGRETAEISAAITQNSHLPSVRSGRRRGGIGKQGHVRRSARPEEKETTDLRIRTGGPGGARIDRKKSTWRVQHWKQGWNEKGNKLSEVQGRRRSFRELSESEFERAVVPQQSLSRETPRIGVGLESPRLLCARKSKSYTSPFR
jgi:hypothetical protein